MKNIFVRTFILFPFLIVNWAALHDITAGEPNTYMEYSVIAVSVLLIIYLIANRYVKLKHNRL